jgi:hypothetical protein
MCVITTPCQIPRQPPTMADGADWASLEADWDSQAEGWALWPPAARHWVGVRANQDPGSSYDGFFVILMGSSPSVAPDSSQWSGC